MIISSAAETCLKKVFGSEFGYRKIMLKVGSIKKAHRINKTETSR